MNLFPPLLCPVRTPQHRLRFLVFFSPLSSSVFINSRPQRRAARGGLGTGGCSVQGRGRGTGPPKHLEKPREPLRSPRTGQGSLLHLLAPLVPPEPPGRDAAGVRTGTTPGLRGSSPMGLGRAGGAHGAWGTPGAPRGTPEAGRGGGQGLVASCGGGREGGRGGRREGERGGGKERGKERRRGGREGGKEVSLCPPGAAAAPHPRAERRGAPPGPASPFAHSRVSKRSG